MGSVPVVERSWLLVMESSMSSGARVALFCLIGLLLVILGILIAFAIVIRKRPDDASEADDDPDYAMDGLGDEAFMAESFGSVASESGTVAQLGGGVSAAVACPSCRREYDGGLRFCPHDARQLVPQSEMSERSHKSGSVCPSCRRSFDPGVRFCPHDAAELVAGTVFRATGRGRTNKPTGVVAKICPQCRRRHDLADTFCGKDGSELVVIN